MENIKDIIACGFDEERTFIFTDFNYLGGAFSRNIKRIQRCACHEPSIHVCDMRCRLSSCIPASGSMYMFTSMQPFVTGSDSRFRSELDLAGCSSHLPVQLHDL